MDILHREFMNGGVAAIVMACALFTGCETVTQFSYPAEAGTLYHAPQGKATGKVVAVLPFGDCRGEENSEALMGFYLLPGSPFGTVAYDRPERAYTFVTIEEYRTTPFIDLPKATAASLRQSGLFKDAFFAIGSNLDMADFILAGRLDEMSYSGTVYSYGLSVVGPVIWALGAPAGTSVNTLAFKLELRNRQGTVVWRHSFRRTRELIQGIYLHAGEDCTGFSELFQSGMNEALEDLVRCMDENPAAFK